MMEHTPGPWLIADDGRFVYALGGIGGSNRFHAHVAPGHIPGYDNEETQQANAALIASAPDLLAACKAVSDQQDRITGPDYLIHRTTMEKVLSAIAKAEGGANENKG